MNKELNDYITQRYDRWLDYSEYHCSHAGMDGEAVDVLNEVLYSLLQKDESFLLDLLHAKRKKYCELDFFLLRMIKLNIISPTSPYQHDYRSVLKDDNVDFANVDIEDVIDDDTDTAGEVLEKMHKVRDTLEQLDLSEKAKRIFCYRFFEDESFSDWPGEESLNELYEIYNSVLELIKGKINNKFLF